MSDSENQRERLNIAVDKDYKKTIEAAAARENLTVTSWVTCAINDRLKAQGE